MFEKGIDNRIIEYYNLDVDKKNICSNAGMELEIVSWQYVCNS